MHSKAIAATCDYMKNLIEGGMREAQDRVADQDVELKVFMRFIEWAYRGDYTVPSWTLDEAVQPKVPVPEVSESTVEEDPQIPGEPDEPAKKKTSSKSRTKVFRTEYFNTREFPQATDAQEAIATGCVPMWNTAPEQDFTPVFLAHVRLYSFAEMRLIHKLKMLTLYKLHCTLRNFTLYPERVGDPIQLVRCAYENTPNRTEDGITDDLRCLVVLYVVCEHAVIGRDLDFKDLLEEGGEFVSEFWGVFNKHVV